MSEPLLEFADVMRRLRAECPWKAAQTHASLARYLLEEAHETLEALDTGDVAHLREELGDLLLQVFLHTAIAEEAGEFTLDDVASDATAKMVRRNPHVFEVEGPSALTPAEVNAEWERRKGVEESRRGPRSWTACRRACLRSSWRTRRSTGWRGPPGGRPRDRRP